MIDFQDHNFLKAWPFQEAMKIVKNLGESKKFTMILEKKVGIYFDPSVDLTSLATKTYNSKK